MQHQEIKEVWLIFDGYEDITPVACFSSAARALEFIETNTKNSRYGLVIRTSSLDSVESYNWKDY